MHYSDVTWTQSPKSMATQLFVQQIVHTSNKWNIKICIVDLEGNLTVNDEPEMMNEFLCRHGYFLWHSFKEAFCVIHQNYR